MGFPYEGITAALAPAPGATCAIDIPGFGPCPFQQPHEHDPWTRRARHTRASRVPAPDLTTYSGPPACT